MGDGFSDVKLEWQGETYTVPADRVFELVRRIEDIIMNGGSVAAFVLLLQNRVSQSTLAMAYSEALRFAGADVSGQSVYLDLMRNFADNASDAAVQMQNAIVGLLCIISPPMADEILGGSEEKKD